MRSHQREFISMVLSKQVLRFGDFTLKSGRTSPYFFNAGLINDGASLARIGGSYAQALIDAGVAFDMLFGPAYKGIPLATATAVAFAERHRRNVPFAPRAPPCASPSDSSSRPAPPPPAWCSRSTARSAARAGFRRSRRSRRPGRSP
jgi:hypothetical protein